jgi:hypothetical protein
MCTFSKMPRDCNCELFIFETQKHEQYRKKHVTFIVKQMFGTNAHSWVSIVTRLWAGRQGFNSWQATTVSRQALGPTQPPAQWVPEVLSPGVRWPGREADRLPPSIAQFKNTWSYISTPPYVFMEWCLVKHRDKFTYTKWTWKWQVRYRKYEGVSKSFRTGCLGARTSNGKVFCH